jgi:small subunit ribosomal protein S17
MSDEVASGRRRQVRGRVVSDKMDKTVVVAVERTVKHPRYRKYLTRVRTFKAHDEENTCKVNDFVVIEESRPLSRTKRWVVVERLNAAGN